MENKTSFEEVLAREGRLVYTAVGDSMFPQIQPRDLLVIEAPREPLQINDVPLYRRKSGQYVLHRIVDRNRSGYVTKGDNRSQTETGVRPDQIIGVLRSVIRAGRSRPVLPPQIYAERVGQDLLLLLRCALDGSAPDPARVEDMDLAAILRLAQRHRLAAAAAFALERSGPLPHDFDQAKKKAMRKLALFEVERGLVTQALEARGIAYMPLKGILLRRDWPKAAMREMDDNDLLVDPARMKEVRAVMEGLGYTCEQFGRENHDVYSKPPTLEFEMHWALFDRDAEPRLAAYYDGILDRAKGEGCARRLTDEEFYLYFLCHAYKHYSHAGMGLRSLMDLYLYREAHPDLDRAWLDRELEALGIRGFEAELGGLAQRFFRSQALTERDQVLLRDLLASGSTGTPQRAEAARIARAFAADDSPAAKRRYWRERVFLPEELLQKQYPLVAKHRALYPLLLLRRGLRGLGKPGRLLKEYRRVRRFHRRSGPI